MAAYIYELNRLVSDGNVYIRNTREEAINAFLDQAIDSIYTPTGVVRLFSVPERYPKLKEFDDDNSNFGRYFVEPNFIWDTVNQISGSGRGFATGFNYALASVENYNFLFYLLAFADNAFNFKLSVYDSTNRDLVFEVTPPEGLQDGSMEPNVGLTEIQPPYGWQNVRYYSTIFNISGSVTTQYTLVLSFEVQNYLVPNDIAFNPAALAFVADFYNSLYAIPT